MGTVTHLEDVLRARDTIREEQAVESLRRDPLADAGNRNERIHRYRQKAEELRTISEDVILYETKQTLLSLSCSYEYMADAVERMQLADN
jgi:hypothetical protein